jgi:HEAT repeat protein
MKRPGILLLFASLMLAHSALAQSSQPLHEPLDFGIEGLVIPPAVTVHAHTPRTPQLLGEAYRRHEALVWKRAQYVAELGAVGLPAGGAYLAEAMKDPAASVRGEAARSAGLIGDAALLGEVEKLLDDTDETVRRAAVLAAAQIARAQGKPTIAIERGLSDSRPAVIAAALQAAWLSEHARLIAERATALPPELKPQAALALARLKASKGIAPASIVRDLLNGDVVARCAAVEALGEIGDPAQASTVLEKLNDPHPTVRRAAVRAMGQLADPTTRRSRAIQMLNDPDLTVRQSAAEVLTPVSSAEGVAALVQQLDPEYAPLHESVRAALIHPADAKTRDSVIQFAAAMLQNANPRRREDASYILGRLRSAAGIERHVAFLQWETVHPEKADWSLIAQAAESLGLIGDARALPGLMGLVTPAPQASAALQRPQRDVMNIALANAMVAAARLRHPPALTEAVRILQINPDACPHNLRAGAAFAVGVLATTDGKAPQADKLLDVYDSIYEDRPTKFEALKALGNLHYAPAAERLKVISESDQWPDLRWMAHWSYERASGTHVPYAPPVLRSEPPVLISDLPK